MKKFLLKTTPILAAALLITGTMLFAGCEKEKDTSNTTNAQKEIIINPITPNASVKENLDVFFSKWNDTITKNYSNCAFVINNMNDLKRLGCDDLNIDFDKYCLIWGKVTAYHTGYVILNRTLFNSGNDVYHYDVVLHIGEAGYDAVFNLYFWDIYPVRNVNNIVLIVKNI